MNYFIMFMQIVTFAYLLQYSINNYIGNLTNKDNYMNQHKLTNYNNNTFYGWYTRITDDDRSFAVYWGRNNGDNIITLIYHVDNKTEAVTVHPQYYEQIGDCKFTEYGSMCFSTVDNTTSYDISNLIDKYGNVYTFNLFVNNSNPIFYDEDINSAFSYVLGSYIDTRNIFGTSFRGKYNLLVEKNTDRYTISYRGNGYVHQENKQGYYPTTSTYLQYSSSNLSFVLVGTNMNFLKHGFMQHNIMNYGIDNVLFPYEIMWSGFIKLNNKYHKITYATTTIYEFNNTKFEDLHMNIYSRNLHAVLDIHSFGKESFVKINHPLQQSFVRNNKTVNFAPRAYQNFGSIGTIHITNKNKNITRNIYSVAVEYI